MEASAPKRQPGEIFLDRYMPTATEAERAEALANLRGLIAVLVEIDDRLADDSRESDVRGRFRLPAYPPAI